MKDPTTLLRLIDRIPSSRLCLLIVSCWFLCLDQAQAQPVLSPQKLLGFLPPGSRLADDIPTHQFDPADVTRENIITDDLDLDGVSEKIIAYYTPPHSPDDPPEKGDFFRRAHVKVLRFRSGNWEELWDSGGWGDHFRGGMSQHYSPSLQEEYTRNYFAVAHFVGSPTPVIIFTRSSFGAEGTEFEAWRWETDTFVKKLELPVIARVTRAQDGRATEIVQDLGWKGEPLEMYKVFRFDQGVFKMTPRTAAGQ